MKRKLLIIWSCTVILIVLFITIYMVKKNKDDREKDDVDMIRSVSINDDFWQKRQKLCICVSVEAVAKQVEDSGVINNLINASNKNKGLEYTPGYFGSAEDTNVYKTVEAMCYALMIDAGDDSDIAQSQKAIMAKLEEWIPCITGVIDDEGYIVACFIINEGRWTAFHAHELYVSGHFFEAAIAHYNMTKGKDTRLLDMAVKNANYLCSKFGKGEGKWNQVPGHQEVELALVKLAALVKSIGGKYGKYADRYIELAEFFLDARGDRSERIWSTAAPAEGIEKFPGEYNQDHMPSYEQTEAVGHAVRAVYMYIGMARCDLYNDNTKYEKALKSLWDDVVTSKSYVTGGVGNNPKNEGFGDSYDLSFDTAYCESCSSIAMMMWGKEMSELYDDSCYADQVEKILYNSYLSSISFSGSEFFYQNPVKSGGNVKRSSWFACACCPPNILRFMLSLQNYIYKAENNEISVLQYIGNNAAFNISGSNVEIQMTSAMPWSGDTTLSIATDKACDITLKLRIPAWAKYNNSIKLNGEDCEYDVQNGFAVISRTFNDGDVITLSFEMNVVKTYNSEDPLSLNGYVSVSRGPVVYAAEKIDNPYHLSYVTIPKDRSIQVVSEGFETLCPDNGYAVSEIYTVSINATLRNEPVVLKMIPYYAFANRGECLMYTYFSEE